MTINWISSRQAILGRLSHGRTWPRRYTTAEALRGSVGTGAALIALIWPLTGCSDTSKPAPAPAPLSSPAAQSPTSPATAASATSTAPDDSTDAVTFGHAFWTVFYGRAALPKDQWWSQLEPLLTPTAAADYRYTDPRMLTPAPKISGTFTQTAVAPDVPGVTAEVLAPTDRGTFKLYLARTTKTAPWRLESVAFPKGVQ